MTLDQLTTFLWVSRLGGVRKAALEMNISQPAVSSRIAALEESLGTTLFDRAQRGVTLTKKGVLLREYAENIINTIEDIKANVVPTEAIDSLLRIGVAETIVQLWLPNFLANLYDKYPNIKVEIVVDVSVNLRQQLLERSLDFAIMMGPVSEYSIDNIWLPAIELTWFRAKDKPDVDFNTVPVVSYTRQSRPFRELRGELHSRYGQNAQVFPSSSIYAGLEMVASGIGVGLFPHQLGLELIKQGRIVAFDPGWTLDPLQFTASYVGEPRNKLYSDAAAIAARTATEYLGE